MSISQNFPTITPTLNLNFTRSKKLDPRITFTRTSSATRTNGQGLIEVVGADTPRFEHSVVGVGSTVTSVQSLGLLIEESRTNLTTYSEQFNNAAWTKNNAGITTNTSATTAPDGSTTAEKLVEDTSNGEHRFYQGVSASSGTTYTFSCFLKAAERSWVEFGIQDPGGGVYYRFFNISTGVAGNSGNNSNYIITSYPNGWYRISLTFTALNTGTLYGLIWAATSDGTASYTGDGTSGIYMWGAQLEAGAFPTSYIPTVASTVTRSADNASMTGTNFSSWYNSSEGTLGFIGDTVSASSYSGIYQIDNGDANNRLYLDKNSSSARVVSTVSGGNQCLITLSTISSNTVFKLYGAYKLNDCAGSFNGGTVGTDTTATMPTCSGARIGSDGNNYINGRVSQLTYYPRRLTNAQLQNLTK